MLHFICNHNRWLHVKQNTELISKLFHNNFILHVTTALGGLRTLLFITAFGNKKHITTRLLFIQYT